MGGLSSAIFKMSRHLEIESDKGLMGELRRAKFKSSAIFKMGRHLKVESDKGVMGELSRAPTGPCQAGTGHQWTL